MKYGEICAQGDEMSFVLAIFRSRFATLSFAKMLRENNVPVAVINTPHKLAESCGLSVKFAQEYFLIAQRLLAKSNLMRNFAGFYGFVQRNGLFEVVKM